MKKLFFVFAFIALGLTSAKAQTSFSCTYRSYCYWNETSGKYENCQGYDESSLFVMNDAETMFTHTIETMKSTYYVDSKEYDSKNDVYTYYATSDVGNKYFYIFDPKSKEVRAVFTNDGKTVLLTFTVKAMF
jgi:hypothetical protein